MKKFILFSLLLIAGKVYADDTATLQALVTAGNTTLPAGHAAYHITSITLSHSLNANGDTIFCTAASGVEFTMNTASVKLSNGIFIGPTDVYNSTGPACVGVSKDHDTITNCTIKTFPLYGITASGGNFQVYTNNTISDTAYIGQFYDPSANTTGGIISGNTYDRSMLSASTITQPDLIIQTTSSSFKTRGWTISNNTFKMPSNPTDFTAAGFELRYCPRCTVSSSICQGGSIGESIVASDSVKTLGGTFTGQNNEALEYASSSYGNITNTNISSQLGKGIIFDGSPGPVSHDDTVYNAIISGCASNAALVSVSCYNIFFLSCSFTETATNVDAVYIQKGTNIGFCVCTFSGGSSGRNAVMLDNSTGTIDMCSGTVSNFTGHVFNVFANTAIVINNILMQNATVSGTTLGLGSTLSGGASLGSNIQVN
ncbi:MAG: hypothetical protein ACHQHN_07055 [Sphingobacteriales bacterium]